MNQGIYLSLYESKYKMVLHSENIFFLSIILSDETEADEAYLE